VLAVALCSTAALPTVSVAGVQPVPEPGASAVQQYVEDVPTARGQSTPGRAQPSGQALTPAAERALRRASPTIAAALVTIATSPAYGAPTQMASSGPASGQGSSLGGSLGSTADAIGSASDTRLLGLLVVLIATTGVAIGLAVRRVPA
jgi:hypothetical protein